MYPSYNNNSREGFLFLSYCLQPKSRGSVSLRSNNIRHHPKIDPAYLQHYDDVLCTHGGRQIFFIAIHHLSLPCLSFSVALCMMKVNFPAINFALQTLETPKFRDYGANVHHPDLEECRHLPQDYRDIEYTECVLRVGALTSYHVCGSCRMGTDDRAVVDEKLR